MTPLSNCDVIPVLRDNRNVVPSLNDSGGYVFLLSCFVALAACAFVVASPIRLFRLVSLGRPLPKPIEKR